MSIKFLQTKKTTLSYAISDSATTIQLDELLKLDGTSVAASDIGDALQGTFAPGTAREEIFEIDGANVTINADGTVTITSVLRGRKEVSPYGSGGFSADHDAGEVVVFGNNPQLYNRMAILANTNAFTGNNSFTLLPTSTGGNATSGTELITYAQALALATGTASINRIVVAGNGGEVITAGQLLYLLVTDGEWYKCDADTAATVDNIILGIAQGAGTDGGAITNGVLLFGLDSNQTGLTTNTAYYASNTAGAISSTPGTVEVSVGISRSTTSFIFYPRYNQQLTEDQQDALAGSSGTPSGSNKFVTNDDTSTTGSGSKIPRGVSGKIDNSWLPESLISVVSGENITANKPVYINPSDSSIYTAHGFKELDSTAISLTSGTSHKVAKLSDTQMMFLTDNGTTTLTITVYDINSAASVAAQTVTTAFDQTVSSTPTLPSATMCRLSDTTFIVFYARTTDNALYFRTGSISGATITMDTETAYTGSPTYCFGLDAVPGDSNGKVVLAYQNGTVDNGSGGTITNKLAYLTCSTNTATVTYSVSATAYTSSPYNATSWWTVAQFTRGMAYGLFCTNGAGGTREILYSCIDTITGTTSADNQTVGLETPTGAGVSSTYSQYLPYVVPHNGSIYFGWEVYGSTDAVINIKTVLKASPIGCKIVYQSSITRLAGDTTSRALEMFGNEMGVIVYGFNDSASVERISIYIQKDAIYEFYGKTTLGLTNGYTTAMSWYSNIKDEVIVCGIDASGFIKQWRIPTPVDGFVTSSVTAPASATVYNVTATTTGLTANAKYYLKDTYTTVGDLNTIGTIPVGDALSTTVIKLEQ